MTKPLSATLSFHPDFFNLIKDGVASSDTVFGKRYYLQLQLLRHAEIDKQRWLQTLLHSPNGLIYAWPQYLDITSPGWEALVNEDYSLLMPLTFRRKWGIRYLAQSAFCQQLGVFGSREIRENDVKEFLYQARQQVAFAEIRINYQNRFPSDDLILQKNYVLSLAASYQEIRAGYSKELLKKNLQRVEKFSLQYTATENVDLAIGTFQDLYAGRLGKIKSKDYEMLLQLCRQLQGRGNAFVREVCLPNGELLACGVFLRDDRRIYNIASSTLPNGRTLEANHFLFDQLIQEFAGSGLLLDFEGSDVPGIERFYKKFGPACQAYFFIRWNNLPWPLRLLKNKKPGI